MNVLSTLKSAQLSSGDGQLNLQPILEAQKNIATANQSLQQQVQKYQQLPKAHIGMVKNAYTAGNTQLTKMATKSISCPARSRFYRTSSVPISRARMR